MIASFMRPTWRPHLGQYTFPERPPTASERVERQLDALNGAIRPYTTIRFDPTTARRLDQEIATCEALIGRILVDIDPVEAERQAQACIENLKNTLRQASDEHFAMRQELAEQEFSTGMTALAILSAASAGVSAYHGYKRNKSVGWAVWWGFMGALFPIVTPAVAIAQGFGKRTRS